MYQISITPQEIEKMPLGCFPGEIVIVDRPGLKLLRAARYLASQKLLGFDTETRPCFSPDQHHNGVALLQLSGPDKAYLFRIQKTGIPGCLRKVLSNPDIIKVGAAVHDDVRGLQKVEAFQEKGFVDLQCIGWEWGIRDKSVKKMAAIIMGVRISKTQQLSNWEAETLSEPQQKYAATDAWVCREMYLKLLDSEKHPLTPEERNPQQFQQQQAKAEAEARKAAEKKAQEQEQSEARKAAARRRRRRRRKPSASAAVAEGTAKSSSSNE